jgi:hypothetical protein
MSKSKKIHNRNKRNKRMTHKRMTHKRMTKKRMTQNKRMTHKRMTQNKRNILARGPSSPKDTVPCSMCDRKVPLDNSFVPLLCLNKYGRRAHRICEDCWWDPNIGFAREGEAHDCPGCKRNLPILPPVPKSTKAPKSEEIIIISD